jgi:hypothetical protein
VGQELHQALQAHLYPTLAVEVVAAGHLLEVLLAVRVVVVLVETLVQQEPLEPLILVAVVVVVETLQETVEQAALAL